jgi:hypothetical protein
VFSEGFKGNYTVVRGTMTITLAYVLRDHDVVTPAMRIADYSTTSSDMRLMNLVQLDGREFHKDNTLV